MITFFPIIARRFVGLCLSCCVLCSELSAQEAGIWLIEIAHAEHLPGAIRQWNGRKVPDQDLNTERYAFQMQAYRLGYIDIQWLPDSVGKEKLIRVDVGKPFHWASITLNDESEALARKARVRIIALEGKPLSPAGLEKSIEAILKASENNGFPFAAVRLENMVWDDHWVRCSLVVEKGPRVKLDSVIVKGNARVREGYLQSYLDMKEGEAYNESAVQGMDEKLKDIPFLVSTRPSEVQFTEEKTKVFMYLDGRKSSRIEGLLGFLPDEVTGKVQFTGEASVFLQNSLKQGETMELKWRRLQTNTQELDASALVPFILNTPVSPDATLKIYRRDTLFADRFLQLGFRFILNRNNYLRVFTDRQTTDLISVTPYKNSSVVPPFLDRAVQSYGVGVNYSRIDYMPNPAKGWEFYAEGAAGFKTITKNAQLSESIYDSLELRSVQFRAKARFAYYVQLVPRLIWHQAITFSGIKNDQLFNNEAARIGGVKTLRGFNEESIFATSFSIARNELRYQTERDGYVFLFFDQAWYENASLNRFGAARRDTPYSFGTGLTFGTKAGVFSLSYALGSQLGNPILLRGGKIHLGFVSLF